MRTTVNQPPNPLSTPIPGARRLSAPAGSTLLTAPPDPNPRVFLGSCRDLPPRQTVRAAHSQAAAEASQCGVLSGCSCDVEICDDPDGSADYLTAVAGPELGNA